MLVSAGKVALAWVADMDLFIDTDGDGVVNGDDTDDDGDGVADVDDDTPYGDGQ